MILVLVRRSRKVVPEEIVTLMSWDPRHFLSCLVMVGEVCGQGGSCLFTLICSYSFVRRRDQYNILYKMYMYLYCTMYNVYSIFLFCPYKRFAFTEVSNPFGRPG